MFLLFAARLIPTVSILVLVSQGTNVGGFLRHIPKKGHWVMDHRKDNLSISLPVSRFTLLQSILYMHDRVIFLKYKSGVIPLLHGLW